MGIADFENTFVKRYPRANRKNQDGNHETPEIEFRPVAEGVGGVGLASRLADAIEQQSLVSSIDNRMNGLGQHGRRTCIGGRDKLGHRDQ